MKIISRKEAQNLGLTHYFTGKECPNGHISVRFVSSYSCQECANEHKRRYRKNPEFKAKEMVYKKKYREENKEKINLYSRKKWRTCKITRERSKEHSRKNAAKRNRYSSRYYFENKEKILARAALWRKKNMGYFTHKNRERRAILRGANGSHSRQDVHRLLILQKHKCVNCLVSVRSGYHVDHIIPLSKGGDNGVDNLQILCPKCNLRKNAKDPIDWAQQNGRLL